MAKGKRRSKPLLIGAMAHGAEGLKALIKVEHISPKAARALLQVLKRTPVVNEAHEMVLALTKRDGSRRPLAEILAEGPIPGRLPRPPGAPRPPAEPPRPRFKRGVDPSTSFEPVPGELQGLLNTKKITQKSREAAERLGFQKNANGSALEALYGFLYPTLYRQSAKRRRPKPPKEGAPKDQGEHAGVWSNIFSPITEFVLNQNPSLLKSEQDAVDRALQAMAAKDKSLRIANYAGVPPPPPQRLPFEPNMVEAVAMLRTRRPAEGVLDLELFNVRDNVGKAGLPITDRLRGLLDYRKTPPEFTIVSIGEAKAESKYNKIIGQAVQDVERLVAGLRASQIGVPLGTFGPEQVKFGPKLVVAILSEKKPPDSHVASLEGRLKAAFKTAKREVPELKRETLDPGSTFRDAKTIASEFQSALNELALGPKK
jgi:hypothetical protein